LIDLLHTRLDKSAMRSQVPYGGRLVTYPPTPFPY
jgi:hypothetical protein